MDDENHSLVQRLRFDAEDFLPPEYWSRVRTPQPAGTETKEGRTSSRLMTASVSSEVEEASTSKATRKLNPDEWVKAPEFVPRAMNLLQSFEWDGVTGIGWCLGKKHKFKKKFQKKLQNLYSNSDLAFQTQRG